MRQTTYLFLLFIRIKAQLLFELRRYSANAENLDFFFLTIMVSLFPLWKVRLKKFWSFSSLLGFLFVWLWVFIGLFVCFQSMQAKILGEMPQHICSVFIFQGRRKKGCYWVFRGEQVQCVNFSKQLRIHTKEKYLIKVPHNLGHFNWNL